MNEIVKEIPGFNNYFISNHGAVYGPRYGMWKCLKHDVGPDGYHRVTLYRDKIPYGFLVHRLALLTFVGPCPENYVACHYDGEKGNNYLSNLRWDTQKANEHDKERHGTYLNGKVISDSCRQASIKARTGLKHTPEIREKISQAVKAAKQRVAG